jgi:hypothetical protein
MTREEVEVELERGDGMPPFDGSEGGEVVDYRNRGVPQTEVWVRLVDLPQPQQSQSQSQRLPPPPLPPVGQKPLGGGGGGGGLATDRKASPSPLKKRGEPEKDKTTTTNEWDPNLRGRGRTVETQGGGLAVLRALWVVSKHEL